MQKIFLFADYLYTQIRYFSSIIRMNELIESLVKKFFEWLGITIQSISTELVEKDVNIRLETPDSSLIIGMHGANLASFQHLLSRMIEKVSKDYIHVHLEVNDYMKAKDERLFHFLDTKIAFVTSTGRSSRIPNLTSYERKKAHNYISERHIAWLSTHSDGEGAERALVLEFSGTVVSSPAIATSRERPTTHAVENLSEDGVGI